jgi:cytosine/adenosine deaminase-related metal-dependent hydrolase
LGDVTGSLTPGKRADLILIRTTDLNIAPLAQIETTVVQSTAPANVDTVMVDGRILKRNGQLLHLNVPDIVHHAERSALRIREAAGGVLKPVSAAVGNPVFRAAC